VIPTIKKILEFVSRLPVYISGWIAIFLFNWLIVPGFSKWFGVTLDPKVIPLDLRFLYDTDHVNELFQTLGAEGRRVYTLFEILADIPYIFVYTLVYMATIYMLYKKNWHWAILPFLVGAFDLAENFSILYLLHQYPQLDITPVLFSSIMTSLKWSFAALTLLWVIVGLIKKIFFKPPENEYEEIQLFP